MTRDARRKRLAVVGAQAPKPTRHVEICPVSPPAMLPNSEGEVILVCQSAWQRNALSVHLLVMTPLA